MARPKRFGDEQQKEMRRLYWKEQWSCAQVAKHFQTGPSYVAKVVGGSRQDKLVTGWYAG